MQKIQKKKKNTQNLNSVKQNLKKIQKPKKNQFKFSLPYNLTFTMWASFR